MKKYYVYIMTNGSGTLYTGMTNDLMKRVWEHKEGKSAGFTQKYKTKRLVYFEDTQNVRAAIEREKQIKGWVRKKKIELVESMNPKWEDLSREWFEKQDSSA
ncbi:MAG: GIY-YIG nuclease family protein [Nitrospinae bacterium]|nr:GIY-YIG nuclease family protein [Nitrospinota bacterium]